MADQDDEDIRARRILRAAAKISAGKVIEYRSRGLRIIQPAGHDSRRNLKVPTIGHVKGERWFRRGSYYEILKAPMLCERVPLP